MKKLLLFLIVTTGFLTGCATREKYVNKLNTLVGKQESQLVSMWGMPTSMYEADGLRYLTYTRSETVYIAGTPAKTTTTYYLGKPIPFQTVGTSDYSYTKDCTTTFTVINKVISSFRIQGNDCLSD